MKNSDIKVAILDNAIDPDVYTPIAHWASFLPVPWRAFRAPNGKLPGLRDGFTHIILTGSEASIVERDRWVEEEVSFVQGAAAQGIPILGSCWGHQLLALAVLGPEHVRRCPLPELGWMPIKAIQEDPLLPPGETFFVFTLHFDEAVDVEREFTVIASTELCQAHIMRHKIWPIWGIQSHPEINIPAAKELLRNFQISDPARKALYLSALQKSPRDSGSIEHIVQHFLQTRPLA